MMSWTEEEARRHVAAFERSGLSLVAFCERLGVSPQRMYYWRARLGGSSGTSSVPQLPQLVEVALRPAPTAAAAAGQIVLEFPSGHVVRVPAAVGLAEVLRAVGLGAC